MNRKVNIDELIEHDVLELTLAGKAYTVGEPQLETFLTLQSDPDKTVPDDELLHLVLKDQGLTREIIGGLGMKRRMLAAKAIMAHFLADPDELRAMPGMDKVDLLYSTGLGLSLASAGRTRRTPSSGRSG